MRTVFLFAMLSMFYAVTIGLPQQRIKRSEHRKVDTELVRKTADQPMELSQFLAHHSHVKYSDETRDLTAVKDGDLHACFISDYSPTWSMDESDKWHILTNVEPQLLKSDFQFTLFLAQVGPVIYAMCQHTKLYWLIDVGWQYQPSENPDSPTEVVQIPESNVPKKPTLIKDPTAKIVIAPPSVEEYRAQNPNYLVETPPPLPLYQLYQARRK